MSSRKYVYDVLKGLAIISVILYHAGWFPYGYLGVDIFLVLVGYFTTKSIGAQVIKGNFSMVAFLWSRLERLWSIVFMACTISLVIGFVVMLPDDYENLSESVVASLLFSNNFLQWITSRNYWAVINEVKPLMHLWYLGLIFQFYFFFAAVVSILAKPLKGGVICKIRPVLVAGFVLSVSLYFSPVGDEGCHFYYLPWRLFEFFLGALVATVNLRLSSAFRVLGGGAMLALMLCMFPLHEAIGNHMRVFVVALSTSFFILAFNGRDIPECKWLFPVAWCGRASLSLFVWHQIIFAFTRYTYVSEFDAKKLIVLMFVIVLLSMLSFAIIERHRWFNSRRAIVIQGIWFSLLMLYSLYIYFHAGVVRDIPELEVTKANAIKGLHALYNERIMQYERGFSSQDKVRVLVVGDSFARDWCNVLLESEVASRLEISYFRQTKVPADAESRVSNADFIFYTTSGDFDTLPKYLNYTDAENGKVYVVGTKYFGNSNGQIYAKRGSATYFSANVSVPEQHLVRNERQKRQYGSHFIDLFAALEVGAGLMPVFSDEKKCISQDCRHFTRAGAQYVARRIDVRGLLGISGEARE